MINDNVKQKKVIFQYSCYFFYVLFLFRPIHFEGKNVMYSVDGSYIGTMVHVCIYSDDYYTNYCTNR